MDLATTEQVNEELNPESASKTGNTVDDVADGAVPVNVNQELDNATDEGVALGNAHNSIQDAKKKLIASKVVHLGITFGDSDKMKRVKRAISPLDNALLENMPKEEAAFSSALERIKGLYAELIDACTSYVGNIKDRGRGKSDSGKTRLKLTQEILSHTQKEYGAFQVYAKEYFASHGQEGRPWTAVLYQVRAKDMRANTEGFEVVSGALSTVYKRKQNGKTTYIKAEDRLTWKGDEESAIELYLSSGAPKAEETVNMFSQAKKSLGDDINLVWSYIAQALNERINDQLKMNDVEFKNNLKKMREAAFVNALGMLGARDSNVEKYINENKNLVQNFLVYVIRKRKEYSAATEGAGIASGEVISNRNVSTSRVANSLGVDDIVAKSDTILMKAEDGSMINANEMEEAGTSDSKYKVRSLRDCYYMALRTKSKLTYTAEALKQSFELQVLDLICGQVDRHMGNYSAFYTVSGKTITVHGIKAFDNDMSFGIKNLTAMNGDETHAKQLVEGKKISVPYLPKSYYDRIMAYTPEQAAHEQLDIRSKAEIASLQKRLMDVKTQLQKLYTQGRLQLLETEDQWEKALKEYVTGAKRGQFAESYVELII